MTTVLPGSCLKQILSLVVLEATPSPWISHLDFSLETERVYCVPGKHKKKKPEPLPWTRKVYTELETQVGQLKVKF